MRPSDVNRTSELLNRHSGAALKPWNGCLVLATSFVYGPGMVDLSYEPLAPGNPPADRISDRPDISSSRSTDFRNVSSSIDP